MLNLKSLWMYCPNTSKPEHKNINKGSKNFAWSSSMEINISKGLVNVTFSYPSILTVSIYDGCLGIAAAMACWAGQQRPGKEVKHFLIVCVRELLECVEPGPDGVLCEGCRLSPTLSFFLSLSLFFLFSLFFFFLYLCLFSFFFTSLFVSSKPGLTPSWNKDTPLDGWNLKRDAMRFPPLLDFCVKVKCVMSGSPFECVPTPKSIKVFSWCSAYVLGHRMSPVLLNRHLKWLGPRIPEGAYYA